MKNEMSVEEFYNSIPDLHAAWCMIREYAKKHELSPGQVSEIFDQGLAAIVKDRDRDEDDPLKIAIRRNSITLGAPV